jgi:hypothetical protein
MSDDVRIPESRKLSAAWIDRHRNHLLNELARQPAAERRRRRIVIALVPAVLVLFAATAFTTYALTREPSHLESIGCYDRMDLAANVAVVSADGRSPVAICSEVWQQGALGKNVPKSLEPCVLETGAIGVFPGSGPDTCSELGLAPLPASYAAQARRFAGLRDAIVARLGEPASGASKRGPQCVGKADAEAFIRHELDSRGYSDWQITFGGGSFTPQRPCAEPSFDTGAKAVYLTPASR